MFRHAKCIAWKPNFEF